VCGGRTIEGTGGKMDLVRCQTLAGRRTAGENGGGKVKQKSESKMESYKANFKKSNVGSAGF
jgi:hypothetical protein